MLLFVHKTTVSKANPMQTSNSLVSNFVKSLETHPRGQEIISIIEEVLADDSGTVDPAIIALLKELCNNNPSLLVDFWFLRGSILKEEGRDQEAFQVFSEATQWNPEDLGTWLRISDYFKGRKELLYASFFLHEARSCLDSPAAVVDELYQVMQQLESCLSIPPGFKESPVKDPSTSSDPIAPSLPPDGSFHLPPQASNLWDQALECFQEGIKGDDLVYLHAYIHYAHSTIREVLGLDGNFKAGLDRKVAQYGLFQFKPFFIRLNRLRNAVVHDDYLLTVEEAREVHDQVTTFLAFMDQQ